MQRRTFPIHDGVDFKFKKAYEKTMKWIFLGTMFIMNAAFQSLAIEIALVDLYLELALEIDLDLDLDLAQLLENLSDKHLIRQLVLVTLKTKLGLSDSDNTDNPFQSDTVIKNILDLAKVLSLTPKNSQSSIIADLFKQIKKKVSTTNVSRATGSQGNTALSFNSGSQRPRAIKAPDSILPCFAKTGLQLAPTNNLDVSKRRVVGDSTADLIQFPSSSQFPSLWLDDYVHLKNLLKLKKFEDFTNFICGKVLIQVSALDTFQILCNVQKIPSFKGKLLIALERLIYRFELIDKLKDMILTFFGQVARFTDKTWVFPSKDHTAIQSPSQLQLIVSSEGVVGSSSTSEVMYLLSLLIREFPSLLYCLDDCIADLKNYISLFVNCTSMCPPHLAIDKSTKRENESSDESVVDEKDGSYSVGNDDKTLDSEPLDCTGIAVLEEKDGGSAKDSDTNSNGNKSQEESDSVNDTNASKADAHSNSTLYNAPTVTNNNENPGSSSSSEETCTTSSSTSSKTQNKSDTLSSHESSTDEENKKSKSQTPLTKRPKALRSCSERNKTIDKKRKPSKESHSSESETLENEKKKAGKCHSLSSGRRKVYKTRSQRNSVRATCSAIRKQMPSDDWISKSDIKIKQPPPRKKQTTPSPLSKDESGSDLSPCPRSLESEIRLKSPASSDSEMSYYCDESTTDGESEKLDDSDEEYSNHTSPCSPMVQECTFSPSDSKVLVYPTPPSLFQPSDDPPTISPHNSGLLPLTAGMQEAIVPFSYYQEQDEATGQLLVLPGEDNLERAGDCSSQVVCAAPPTRPHLPLIASFVVIVALSFYETGVSLRKALRDWVTCRVPVQVRRMLATLIRFSLQARRVIVPCQGGVQCLHVIRVTRGGEVVVPEEHLVTCTGPRTQLQMLRCLVVMVDYFLEEWDGENAHVVDADHGCHLRTLRQFVSWARELINRGIVAIEDVLLQALHHLEDWTLDQ